MYEKTICPYCGEEYFHNLRVHILETKTGPVIKMVETTETIREDVFIKNLLYSMAEKLTDGIEIHELYATLKTCFGVSPQIVCEVVERIKLEFDMYSPDRKHLYFVCAQE